MRTIITGFCLLVSTPGIVSCAEKSVNYTASDLTKTVNDLAARANHAQHYSWEGTLTIDIRRGNGPFTQASQSKVQVAIGENGKSLLKMQTQGVEEYWLISDGKKTWSYVPGRKQYLEEESGSVATDSSGDEDDGSIAEMYARSAVQKIADVTRRAQSLSWTHATMPLKFDGEKVKWPVIGVVDKPDEGGMQTVAELVMEPDQPVLGLFRWAEIHTEKSETISIRAVIEFSTFSLDEPASEDLFTFDPPKKAKQVEELAIPGQSGSALLNHPAPDFEARTIAGEKVKLSELQGKVVMLDFWASWCPPCRAELPAVAKIYNEYRDKGLVVYGVNDEGHATARKYLDKAGLTLPTLDDSSEKAHRMYRVSAIPTVFVIGADGKVVKWFRGGRSEESLLAALKSAGVAR